MLVSEHNLRTSEHNLRTTDPGRFRDVVPEVAVSIGLLPVTPVYDDLTIAGVMPATVDEITIASIGYQDDLALIEGWGMEDHAVGYYRRFSPTSSHSYHLKMSDTTLRDPHSEQCGNIPDDVL